MADPARRRHDPDPDFGPALRAARLRLGWSLEQLASTAGISLGYASMLENGHRAPSVVTVRALAGVLALSLPERAGDHQRSIHLTPSNPRYGRQAVNWMRRQPCGTEGGAR